MIYKRISNHVFKQTNSATNGKLEMLEGDLKTVKALLQEKEGVSLTGTIQPDIQTSPVKEDCLVTCISIKIITYVIILNWEYQNKLCSKILRLVTIIQINLPHLVRGARTI